MPGRSPHDVPCFTPTNYSRDEGDEGDEGEGGERGRKGQPVGPTHHRPVRFGSVYPIPIPDSNPDPQPSPPSSLAFLKMRPLSPASTQAGAAASFGWSLPWIGVEEGRAPFSSQYFLHLGEELGCRSLALFCTTFYSAPNAERAGGSEWSRRCMVSHVTIRQHEARTYCRYCSYFRTENPATYGPTPPPPAQIVNLGKEKRS